MTSHEIAQAAADLATVAALRAELQAAQQIIEGQRRAIASMQAERDQAQADAAALYYALEISIPTLDEIGDSRAAMVAEHLEVWRDKEKPGARLLERLYLAESNHERAMQSIVDRLDRVEVDSAQARVNDTLIPGLARMLALMLIKDDGALYNYITWQIGSGGHEIGDLELILQRTNGLTPAQKAGELQVERDRLRALAIDLLNQLTTLRMPDESVLWRHGGQPLERAYQALKEELR